MAETKDGGPIKQLDPNTYLQAVAIFAMACHHADKATEFGAALAKTLGRATENDLGHISDHIYGSSFAARPSFDELLKREGFEVLDIAAMLAAREGQGGGS